MARTTPLTKDEKRLETLAIETEKQKKALITHLRKMPIVQIACERSGVGRSTYYQWRAVDRIFARAADRALESGTFLINDMAVSKLIRKIQDENMPAINFWLTHNHPKYATVNRFIPEHEVLTERPSIEEQNVASQFLSQVVAKKTAPDISTEDVKEMIERGFEEAERDEPDRKRMQFFEDDSTSAELST